MSHEFLLRAGAVVAAIALLAGPRLVAAISQAVATRRGRQVTQAASMADAHTVLEIASRLRSAGNAKGVELCQQLLEVMLASETEPKK